MTNLWDETIDILKEHYKTFEDEMVSILEWIEKEVQE